MRYRIENKDVSISISMAFIRVGLSASSENLFPQAIRRTHERKI